MNSGEITTALLLLILIFIGSFIWIIIKKVIKKPKNKLSSKEIKEVNRKPKFCGECGAPLEDADDFCPECGAKVVELHEHTKKKFSTKRNPK